MKKGNARVGATVTSDSNLAPSLNRLLSRPSSWYQLQTSVVWLLRFKKHLLLRFGKSRQGQASLITGPLKVTKIVDASEEIVRLVQRDSRLLQPRSQIVVTPSVLVTNVVTHNHIYPSPPPMLRSHSCLWIGVQITITRLQHC